MSGANCFDLAVDVESAFDQLCAMTWCHQSQIGEWLPWVGRHNMAPPKSTTEWREILRARCLRRNRELGIAAKQVIEVFTVTAWGEIADYAQLLRDFPGVAKSHSNLRALRAKLKRWRPQ